MRIASSTGVEQSGQAVRLTGRLDTAAAADLRRDLAAAVDDGVGDLEVDLGGVTGLDATGLGVLLGAHRRAGRAGRRLVLVDVPPSLGRILLASRLDRILTTRTGAATTPAGR